MTTEPNQRNGDCNDGPVVWSTDTHEFCVVQKTNPVTPTNNFDSYIAKRSFDNAYDDWEEFDLADIPGNPLDLPVRQATGGVPDEHHKWAFARDKAGFIHVSGNQHQSKRKYAKTTVPDDITTLADAKTLIDNSTTGVDTEGEDNLAGYSYNHFMRDPFTEDLYWYFLQTDRTTAPRVAGRDVMLMRLPADPDATWSQEWEFAPGTVAGEFQTCNEVVSDGDPERVYGIGFFDKAGTHHYFGFFQDTHDDQNTRGEMFYVHRLTGTTTYKSITGTTVTMPMQRANVQAMGCQLPDLLDPILQWYQPAVDLDGYPHIIVQGINSSTVRHHWWDGSAWQFENTPGGGNGAGHLFLLGAQLWRTRVANNYLRIYPIGSPTEFRRVSSYVDDSFNPLPDPVRLESGIYAVSAPHIDKPRTYEFGRFIGLPEEPYIGFGAPEGIGAPVDGDYEPYGPGALTTTEDNQIIEYMEFNSAKINNVHNNTIIRNCIWNDTGGFAIEQDPAISAANGMLIEDCTFDGGEDPGDLPAVGYARYTMRRCTFNNYGEGPGLHGEVTIEDCYINVNKDYESVGAHQDGVQCFAGINNVLRRSTVWCDLPFGNAAVQIGTAGDEVDNMIVEYCLLGGGGYTINCGYNVSNPPSGPGSNPTNIHIRFNRFSDTLRSPVGPISIGPGNDVHDNFWYDGPNAGDPI